ncbi:hypothetical protein V6U77_20440, partial [Micromonospora sp. CPCC 205546]
MTVAATVVGAVVTPTDRPLATGVRFVAPTRRLGPATAVDATARLPAAVDTAPGATAALPSAPTAALAATATLAPTGRRPTQAGRPVDRRTTATVDTAAGGSRTGATVDTAASRAGAATAPAAGRRGTAAPATEV